MPRVGAPEVAAAARSAARPGDAPAQRDPLDQRWLRSVALGTIATAGAALLGGWAGLLAAIAALAATLSGELLGRVQSRSGELHDDIARRLGEAAVAVADERVEASAHNPLSGVDELLKEYAAADGSARPAVQRAHELLIDTRRRLQRTAAGRLPWIYSGVPALVGGLASDAYEDPELRYYGDPVNLPDRLRGRRAGAALLRIGRVLDDIRLLHSTEIERVVLMFTLWARALLLVLAPALGALSAAPPPGPGAGWARALPWLLALAWALGIALIAPRVADLAMADISAGRRARGVLLAVELPLAVALALTAPGWATVAFAAGWTNWWQRLGPSTTVPDFSWTRLWIWIAVTSGTQLAGFALAPGEVAALGAGLETAATLGVIAVIGGSYGAMLPASAAILLRVLISGARHQQQASSEAQRIVAKISGAMSDAAAELSGLTARTAADERAAALLRHAARSLSAASGEPKRRGPRTLRDVVTDALIESAQDMWIDSPLAAAVRDQARDEGRPPPVVVDKPSLITTAADEIIVDERVAKTVHRLLVDCIVEARVYGTLRVQTIIRRDGDTVEIRVANPISDAATRKGGGRGGRRIEALAASLPGSTPIFRGITDREFAGLRGDGRLFGVRFAFTVSDTPADEG